MGAAESAPGAADADEAAAFVAITAGSSGNAARAEASTSGEPCSDTRRAKRAASLAGNEADNRSMSGTDFLCKASNT